MIPWEGSRCKRVHELFLLLFSLSLIVHTSVLKGDPEQLRAALPSHHVSHVLLRAMSTPATTQTQWVVVDSSSACVVPHCSLHNVFVFVFLFGLVHASFFSLEAM